MSDAPSRRGFIGRLFGALAATRLPVSSGPRYGEVSYLQPMTLLPDEVGVMVGRVSHYVPRFRPWRINWGGDMSFADSPMSISTSDPVPAADDVKAPVLTIEQVNSIDFGRNVCFDDQLAECIKAEGSINHPLQVELLLDDVM